ncbi:MAG TPA: KTSC domain-containing protein [Burkholderiales bacterium]|jgi:hypothetical protein
MERKRLLGGQLKSAGYDRARRVLEVELANGNLIEYASVGAEIARRLLESSSPWSYYRDNIEEEFSGEVVGRVAGNGAPPNPFE